MDQEELDYLIQLQEVQCLTLVAVEVAVLHLLLNLLELEEQVQLVELVEELEDLERVQLQLLAQ